MAWLCIDAGTSVIKSVVLTNEGHELAMVRSGVSILRPRPDCSEQNMHDVWNAVLETAREAVAKAAVPIHAIATTAQGDGSWLVDSNNHPVHNAILWNDGRAHAIVDEWRTNGTLDEAAKISGSLAYPGLPCSIFRWLDDHQPETLKSAAASLTCNGWLFLNLTGKIAADLSDASNPFADVRTHQYSPQLLKLYGVEQHQRLLPPIDNTPAPLLASIAEAINVPANIPIVMAPYDILATAWGGGAIAAGQACVILGTTICAEVITDAFNIESAGTTIALEDNTLLRAMPTLTGCEALIWAAAQLKLSSIEALNERAELAPIASEGLLFLPYLSPAGERSPFLNPHARASFHGLSLTHDDTHIARSVYEGLAFVIRECLTAASPTPVSEIRICGGGSRSGFWCQMIADVTHCTVIRPEAEELGARGAFLYGRTRLNESPSLATAFAATAPTEQRFEPNSANHAIYNAAYNRFIATRNEAAKGWTAHA
ncbi:MAG: FGGY-family carbohydrate kinase [Acidobacteriota bacterium]